MTKRWISCGSPARYSLLLWPARLLSLAERRLSRTNPLPLPVVAAAHLPLPLPVVAAAHLPLPLPVVAAAHLPLSLPVVAVAHRPLCLQVIRVEPQVDRVEPQVIRVEPRVDRVEPQVIRVEPRVDRVEPQVIRVEPQVDQGPRVDRVDPEPRVDQVGCLRLRGISLLTILQSWPQVLLKTSARVRWGGSLLMRSKSFAQS